MIEQAQDVVQDVANATEIVAPDNVFVEPWWLSRGIVGWINDIFPMVVAYPDNYWQSYRQQIVVVNLTVDVILFVIFALWIMTIEARRYANGQKNVFREVLNENCWLTDRGDYQGGKIIRMLTLIVCMILCGIICVILTFVSSVLLAVWSFVIYMFGFVVVVPSALVVFGIILAIIMDNRFGLWVKLKKLRN